MNPNRAVHFIGEVNSEAIGKTVEKMLRLYGESTAEPIILFICSSGGDLSAAFGFYDFVMALGVPVSTVALGYIRSAAMVLFLSGGKRYVGAHATALIHPSTRSMNSATNNDQRAFLREGEVNDRYYGEIVESRTSCKAEEHFQMKRDVTLLDSAEMIKYGFGHELWLPETKSPA